MTRKEKKAAPHRIVEALQASGTTTGKAISSELNLSYSSVITYCNRLVELGVLTTGSSKYGRKNYSINELSDCKTYFCNVCQKRLGIENLGCRGKCNLCSAPAIRKVMHVCGIHLLTGVIDMAVPPKRGPNHQESTANRMNRLINNLKMSL